MLPITPLFRLTADLADRFYWRAGFDEPCFFGFFIFAAFLFGSCLGSFLNVCIWRMPQGESVVTAPSHCTKCGYEIRWFDNIPILSYTLLRGRCRKCGLRISPRYVIVEILTGLLFAALFYKTVATGQPPATFLTYAAMTMLCVTTVWIDFEHRIIPDATTYPAALFGLAVSAAFPSIWGIESYWQGAVYALAGLIIGGGIPALFAIIGRLIFGQDAFGWGDVKFLMAAGVLLGPAGAFFSLFAGSVIGIFYGVGFAAGRKQSLSKLAIPFGPFLAFAALIWMFAGERILGFYFAHNPHIWDILQQIAH